MIKPKVIACIVVRMHSTRLPRKALEMINGKPMTLCLIERLRMARTLDDIVVCTSRHPNDRVLVEMAETWGVKATAGDEDDTALRLMEAASYHSADLVVRVTGDNPLTDPVNIDRMIRHHIASGADYTRTSGLPLGITAEVLSTAMLPRLHQAMPHPSHGEYLMLYAFDPDRFHCEILEAAPQVYRPYYSVTVDTPADLKLVSTLFSHQGVPETGPTTEQIVEILNNMPGYRGLDGSAPIKVPEGETISYDALLQLLAKRADIAHRRNALRTSASEIMSVNQLM